MVIRYSNLTDIAARISHAENSPESKLIKHVPSGHATSMFRPIREYGTTLSRILKFT